MPFITNATGVSAFNNGPIPAATAGSAGAFTVTSTASCGPSAAGIVARLHARVQLALTGVHGQPVVLDRRQMRTARQHRHFGSAAREAHRQMAADGTGAIDANHAFQPPKSRSGRATWRHAATGRQPSQASYSTVISPAIPSQSWSAQISRNLPAFIGTRYDIDLGPRLHHHLLAAIRQHARVAHGGIGQKLRRGELVQVLAVVHHMDPIRHAVTKRQLVRLEPVIHHQQIDGLRM